MTALPEEMADAVADAAAAAQSLRLIVLATHNLELVRSSPNYRVIEMDHGTIVYDSAPASGD